MILIGLVSVFQMFRLLSQPKMIARKVFISVIIVAMFSRGVYFLLSPMIIDGYLESFPLNGFLFWNHMIDLSFFLAYFMLFVSWAEAYYQASDRSETLIFKNNYVIVSLALFILASIAVIAVFFFISNTDDECKRVDFATTFYIASLNLITAALFGVYGVRLYKLLNENPVLRRRYSWKIKALTWICTLCFLCRTFMMIFSVVSLSNNPDTKSFNLAWYWTLIYFVSLEIIPTCSMLYFLRTPPKKRVSLEVGGVAQQNYSYAPILNQS
ncbi:hypothetical protein CYY_009184 [Polysphondylium violaceum]|uniref:THH1/TOM1/TOM3 domain-containing protein n=1 Tax=Polysphondylium violaceum TaxID=133409 RepID=A0A8J4UWA6_9MYCE|nr:hypothetical protein CYY_009184 [Polysphondylium violaceum]